MAQNGFVEVLIFILFVTSVYSNSTDDNNLLLNKYNCTSGDYYDLVYGGCLSCTNCTRENMKATSPCSLHSNAVCGNCFDGYEKQLQGESIACKKLTGKNEDIAHPGGDNNVAIDSTPSRLSNYATVTQILPERIDVESDSNDVKGHKSTANNDDIFHTMILGKRITS
jgi:hypothetical protein